MAVTVTTLAAWTEGDVTGKRHIVKQVQVDLVTQNSVNATQLGFRALIDVGPATYLEGGSLVGSALPVIDWTAIPHTIIFANPNDPVVIKPAWNTFGVITGRMIFVVRGY